MTFTPKPLLGVAEPFDHPDWLFELKHDGFRAVADVRGHVCTLRSRRWHTFTKFTLLAEEIAHGVDAFNCVLDGEIVCLDADGRSNFYNLLFRRLMPRIESRLLYVDHLRERGHALFNAACERDLEGIVAKWTHGRYEMHDLRIRQTCRERQILPRADERRRTAHQKIVNAPQARRVVVNHAA